jgi:DNA-binding transcriptional ArsR family regulator
MPATYTETTDLRALIHLRPSAAFEMLLSLGSVHTMPARHQAWVEKARAALGPDLVEEVHFFYDGLWHSCALMELPVDYPGAADDAAGFIDYVAAMDPDTFLFYLWGRVVPRAEIGAMRADPARVVRYLYDFYEALWQGKGLDHLNSPALPQSAAEPEALQRRVVTLLRTYYDRVFRAELADLRHCWAVSVAEKQAALARQDPAVFLSRLTEGHAMSPMFPEGIPLREIRLVPSCYIWRSTFQVWGYGTYVVMYDASMTEERVQALDQAAEQITLRAAALADTNRLKILRAISQDEGVYGYKLAVICGISQPAISRHMGILKRAGLVDEVPRDGRVLYRLRRAAVDEFIPQLLRYIDG